VLRPWLEVVSAEVHGKEVTHYVEKLAWLTSIRDWLVEELTYWDVAVVV
jgi:hypothetical protein